MIPDKKWADYVIGLAEKNVSEHNGGPFAAIVLRDGQLIAEGVNRVTLDNDPTAHAEVTAIRHACRILGSFDLSGCVMVASCEPCPMCFGAIYWARLDAVYYVADHTHAAQAGFDDSLIKDELKREYQDTRIEFVHLPHPRAGGPFECWTRNASRIQY